MSSDDFGALVRDLTAVADLIPVKVGQAIQQAALKTSEEWAVKASGNPLGRQYTATIDYTLSNPSAFGLSEFQAEVGPNISRYGGKAGSGGLVPSAGVFDDPLSVGSIKRAPDRSRRRAELFAEMELARGLETAEEQSRAAHGL